MSNPSRTDTFGYTIDDRIGLDERIRLLAPMPVREAVRAGWCVPELLPTKPPAGRLRRWLDAGWPRVSSPTIRVVTACARTHQAIAGGLDRLPDPVKYHLARNAVLVALARRHGGFQAHLPRLGPSDEPWQIIVLSAHDVDEDEFLARLAHEVAHGWIEPPPMAAPEPDDPAVTIERQRLTVALADQWNMRDVALAPYRLQELRAARLAKVWGFAGPAADPQRCRGVARLPGDR